MLICAPPPLQTYREMTVRAKKIKCESEMEELSYCIVILVKLYRRGGEVEATPVLPSDEVDRLA